MSRLLCIAICLTWWLGGVHAFAADPAEEFLGAYQDFQTAEKLERDGEPADALAKYRAAEKVLRGLMQKNPEWQPLVVEYRLQKTSEGISRVEAAARQQPSGSLDVLEGELPSDRSTSRQPSKQRRTAVTATSDDADRDSTGGSLGRQSARQRKQLQELRDENAKLAEQIARMRAELKSAYHEVDKRKTDVVELRSLNRQLKDQLENIKKDTASSDSVLKKKDDEYASLLKEQRRASAERDVLIEENEALVKKIEDAAKYIKTADEAQSAIKKERDEAIAKSRKARDSSDEVDQLTKDNKALAAKLTELGTRLKKAESDRDLKVKQAVKDVERLTKEKTAVDEQLAALNEKLKKVETERDEKTKSQTEAAQQIAKLTEEKSTLSDQLAKLDERVKEAESQRDEKSKAAEEALAAVEKLTEDNSGLTTKLAASEERIRAVEAERNDLLAKLEKVKENTANLENVDLQKTQIAEKLAEVEQRTEEVKEGASLSTEELQKLRSELNSARDDLLAAQVMAQQKDTKISELEKQVDQVTGELASLKLNPAPSEEDQRIQDENALLRGLVLRQLRQAAQVEKGRATLQEEIQRLQLKSETLDKSLAELDAGKLELTEQEKLLFKDPVVVLSESEDGQIAVDMAMTKPANGDKPADQTAEKSTDATVASNGAAGEPSPTPSATPDPDVLPAELKEAVQLAKKLYEEKDFAGAEKQYQKIISQAPENYYALTNLAVTQFHLGRLSAAEVALRKAVAVQPSRPDAYTILGIVNYRQGRFDDGVTVLSRAIELNDKDSAAHNYLGITLSEKGDSERAARELKRAIEINPEYADAHFNLAVVYATTKPPKKDLAKEHYAKATSLGAPPDSSLERLIQ